MRMLLLASVAMTAMVRSGAAPVSNDVTDCVPDESVKVNVCENLLPVTFEQTKRSDDAYALLVKVRTMGTVTGVNRQGRRASAWCRNWFDTRAESVTVTYLGIAAMKEFPRRGTRNRQLVSGVMVADADNGCHEAEYGVKRRESAWARVIQFMAVTSDSAEQNPAKDQRIGRWGMWSIDSATIDGMPQFRLKRLKRGDFVLCGVVHHGEGPVAFIGCKGAKNLHRAAERGVFGTRSFGELITRYNDRETKVLEVSGADPFFDDAWGQCGALGCCASQ